LGVSLHQGVLKARQAPPPPAVPPSTTAPTITASTASVTVVSGSSAAAASISRPQTPQILSTPTPKVSSVPPPLQRQTTQTSTSGGQQKFVIVQQGQAAQSSNVKMQAAQVSVASRKPSFPFKNGKYFRTLTFRSYRCRNKLSLLVVRRPQPRPWPRLALNHRLVVRRVKT
jgi:hypothetical protein